MPGKIREFIVLEVATVWVVLHFLSAWKWLVWKFTISEPSASTHSVFKYMVCFPIFFRFYIHCILFQFNVNPLCNFCTVLKFTYFEPNVIWIPTPLYCKTDTAVVAPASIIFLRLVVFVFVVVVRRLRKKSSLNLYDWNWYEESNFRVDLKTVNY